MTASQVKKQKLASDGQESRQQLAEGQNQTAEIQAQARPENQEDAGPRRVLVIEDEPVILEIVEKSLSEAGFITEVAEDAQAAMMKMGQFGPHLILTDHDMPGMNGLELLKELRRRENYVTVIFMSGRADNDTVVSALKHGADDYIRKPFRLNELVARIEASLRVNDLHRQLMEANQKLQDMVDKDYLTGLYNMRSLYEKIDIEIARTKRFDRRLAAVMIDMDHFKRVNDQHDHLFGSFVLKEVGHLVKDCMREIDFAARYGGDEFLIILTEVRDEHGCKAFCERLRCQIESHLFKDGNDEMELTVSIGYAISDGTNMDARELVRRADHNLYRAKEDGRNRFYGEVLTSKSK